MAHDPAHRWAGGERRPADHVRALMAAAERLLHPTAARPAAGEADGGTRSKDVTQLVEHELAAHLRAVELHEAAAQLQEELGWLARAAAARAHAVRARELSRRARQELARLQALAAAAQQRVHEAHRRLS
jgi:hypothetical protein